MPAALQYIALAVFPLTHLVLLMRMATLATVGPLVLPSILWILAATVFFWAVSINLMRRRLIV